MTEAGATVVALWSYGPIEVGGLQKRMHAHLVVEIKHFKALQHDSAQRQGDQEPIHGQRWPR